MAEHNGVTKTAKQSGSDIRQRREALKKELEELEQRIEDSVGELKGDVQTRLDLSYWVRKHPLEAAGVSIVAGFLLGMRHLGKGRGKRRTPAPGRQETGPVLWPELRRAVTRKAIQHIVDLLDEKIDRMQRDR